MSDILTNGVVHKRTTTNRTATNGERRSIRQKTDLLVSKKILEVNLLKQYVSLFGVFQPSTATSHSVLTLKLESKRKHIKVENQIIVVQRDRST